MVLASAAALACGGDGGAADGSVDAAVDADGATDAAPTCDGAPSISGGDSDGHADPLGVAAGEARAGRMREADLPTDRTGLATWAPGDFVLANERIAVLIEDVGDSDLLEPWGGKPVGIARVEGGRLVAAADFNEVVAGISRFSMATDSVTVLNDGSDGAAAVVRASGFLRPLPFFEEFAAGLLRGEFEDLEVAFDYSLAPGAEVVEVALVVAHGRDRDTRIAQPLTFFFQQNRMAKFAPDVGADFGIASEVPWLGFIDPAATSFAWQSVDGPLTSFIEIANLLFYRSEPITLPACTLVSRPYGRIHVGGPGVDGLQAAIARTEGDATVATSGVVSYGDGTPAAGARVHATSADGRYLTRAIADSDGSFTLHGEAGSLTLTPWIEGAVAIPVIVTAGESDVPLSFGPTGFVSVTVTEDGAPSPARVQVVPLDADAPSPNPMFGEHTERHGRLHVAYPIDGLATLRVPVGAHRVIVSRGYEREIVTEEVDVSAGATVSVDAALERVVATPGVLCGDFHIHTHRSFDTSDSVRFKLTAAAAEGLEIPVRSDHEFVGDFEPEIAALGLEDEMFGVGSLELTTFAWGHFGVFPLVRDDAAVNGGAIPWARRSPAEVFGDVADRGATLIINHPRGGTAITSYFDAVQYDPTTGIAGNEELWNDSFSLIEVFNNEDFDQAETVVQDWFSFLNRGVRMFAVGSSDSHQRAAKPVGYPRTCASLGTDSPAELRVMGPEVLRDTLVAGHATISGGVYVDASVGAAGPGDTAMGVGERAAVSVNVQAASWVDVDRLRVFVDGALAETIPLDDTTSDPLEPTNRFLAGSLEVAVAPGGSWVVLVASGDTDLSPVHPGLNPFGVTNPIFLSP